jgi:hypothetical protein
VRSRGGGWARPRRAERSPTPHDAPVVLYGLSRPLGVHLFLVSRRQRKRSTSNKIRVQRLINITQNRASPDHTDRVWLFPVSFALPLRPSLSLSSLELELHYFYFYRAGSYNSAANFCVKKKWLSLHSTLETCNASALNSVSSRNISVSNRPTSPSTSVHGSFGLVA